MPVSETVPPGISLRMGTSAHPKHRADGLSHCLVAYPNGLALGAIPYTAKETGLMAACEIYIAARFDKPQSPTSSFQATLAVACTLRSTRSSPAD